MSFKFLKERGGVEFYRKGNQCIGFATKHNKHTEVLYYSMVAEELSPDVEETILEGIRTLDRQREE